MSHVDEEFALLDSGRRRAKCKAKAAKRCFRCSERMKQEEKKLGICNACRN